MSLSKEDFQKIAAFLRCEPGSELDPAEEHRMAESLESMAQQKPYGWKVSGVSGLFTGEYAQQDAHSEAAHIGGTCVAFPLFTSVKPEPRTDRPSQENRVKALLRKVAELEGEIERVREQAANNGATA